MRKISARIHAAQASINPQLRRDRMTPPKIASTHSRICAVTTVAKSSHSALSVVFVSSGSSESVNLTSRTNVRLWPSAAKAGSSGQQRLKARETSIQRGCDVCWVCPCLSNASFMSLPCCPKLRDTPKNSFSNTSRIYGRSASFQVIQISATVALADNP